MERHKKTFELEEALRTLPYPDIVLYAGASSRRLEFISRAFKESQINNFSTGEEPNLDVFSVTKFKIDSGKRYLTKINKPLGLSAIVLAADTQTIIPKFYDNEIMLLHKNKPKEIEQVYQSLYDIYESSYITNTDPKYKVTSASGLYHTNGGEITQIEEESSNITLNKKLLSYLITPDGFREYLETFHQFYSSPPYSNYQMNGITPLNLSSGISLPVLVKMNGVSSINNINKEDQRFRTTLMQNIHTVAVGISSRILSRVQVDPKYSIEEWDWLNQVTDKALQKEK